MYQVPDISVRIQILDTTGVETCIVCVCGTSLNTCVNMCNLETCFCTLQFTGLKKCRSMCYKLGDLYVCATSLETCV